jgi:hypothetical protein
VNVLLYFETDMRNNISIIVSVALIVLVSGCIGLTGSETTNTVNTVETTVDTTTNQTVTQSTETETENPTTTQATTDTQTQSPTTTTTESIHDAEVSFEQTSNGSQYDVSVTIEDMGGAEEVKLESPNGNVTIIFEGTHTLFELSEGDTVTAYAIGPDNKIVRIQSYTVQETNSTDTAERLPDPPFNPHPRPNW